MPLPPDLDDGIVPAEEVNFFPADPSPAPAPSTPKDDLPKEFDPKFRDEFSGLLYLGALTHEFSRYGHRFKIKTLTTGELLEVGLAQRQYRDSIGESKAYVTALVAASLVSIDGKPLPLPLTNLPGDTEFANKFAFVRDSYYPWTVDAIYEEFVRLDQRVMQILEAMGEASPPTGASIPG